MLYDVRLELRYTYEGSVRGDRHLIRVQPLNIPGVQRVVAAALAFDPKPENEHVHTDFFGNAVTAIAYTGQHSHLTVRLNARVAVEEAEAPADLSTRLEDLPAEIARVWSVGADSPHHFLSPSPRIPRDAAITDYARAAIAECTTVGEAAMALCLAVYRDFIYDSDATLVDTSPSEAFALKRGVCQDFAQVMIAGLRGVGIPAGYVSGFLRTIPPAGEERLEGADAMHAWVRVWCGQGAGWIGFDPTNAMRAGSDHIIIGYGRDYADISPIVGVIKTSGSGHENVQAVDVVQVE